jgi:hypothetical protein
VRGRNPIQIEPDQRYWRRRANRRVRKARRTMTLLRWTLILAVNGVVAAALMLSAEKTVDYLTRTSEFALKTIDVQGVRRGSAEGIRERLRHYVGHNILDLDLEQIEGEVQSDSWVRRAAVRRLLPSSLLVRVEERDPAALARIEGRIFIVDSTGYVIGPADPDGRDVFPLLTGLEGYDRRTLAVALRRGVGALARLRRANRGFIDEVAELDLSHRDRRGVRTTTGGPVILLDPRRVESNLDSFLELRDAIESRVGSADYIDLRWRDRISVMPASQNVVQ